MSNKSDDQKARESFSSILSYYLHNRESLENVPDWLESVDSSAISMALDAKTVPSNEQTEELKGELRKIIAHREALDKLSEAEKNVMILAANTSKARRKGGK